MIGVVLGLSITLIFYLRHSATVLAVEHSEGLTRVRDHTRESQDGDVRTLGISDSAAPESKTMPLNPRVEALIQVIVARMQTGNFDKALKVASAMEAGPERDAGLEEIADRLVPNTAQANLNQIDSGSDRTRATALEKLRKLLHVSELAKGGLIKSRLLVRAAMVKRLLDVVRPGTTGASEDDLDPESLIARAEAVAKAMPAAEVIRVQPFQWVWGMLLSGLLGLVGFISTHLAEPVINACGAILGSFAVRRSGVKLLAEKLEEEEEKALKS
jgi:hypothetical protein